jgi:hypothetical protein
MHTRYLDLARQGVAWREPSDSRRVSALVWVVPCALIQVAFWSWVFG